MNIAAAVALAMPALGSPFGGGRFMGVYLHGTERRALIVAPRADGQFTEVQWTKDYGDVQDASSYVDGLSNTEAMARAGSALAKRLREITIGGFKDWHLPALDQLEVLYRAAKPGTAKNDQWLRSGINLHSIPASHPYTAKLPAQTDLADFRTGGAEALPEEWHWTSTLFAGNSFCAWIQSFGYGGQGYCHRDNRYCARAVRSEPI